MPWKPWVLGSPNLSLANALVDTELMSIKHRATITFIYFFQIWYRMCWFLFSTIFDSSSVCILSFKQWNDPFSFRSSVSLLEMQFLLSCSIAQVLIKFQPAQYFSSLSTIICEHWRSWGFACIVQPNRLRGGPNKIHTGTCVLSRKAGKPFFDAAFRHMVFTLKHKPIKPLLLQVSIHLYF